MINIAENIDNEYVHKAIIAIRENNKRPDIKTIKDCINKNSPTDVEEQLIESTVMELFDHNITENRPAPKGNSYFIRKKNTPIDVISINRTPQINQCELVSDTGQQFNDITLKSPNTPVIRSTPVCYPTRKIYQIDATIQKTSLNNLKLIILRFLNSKIMSIKSLMKLR